MKGCGHMSKDRIQRTVASALLKAKLKELNKIANRIEEIGNGNILHGRQITYGTCYDIARDLRDICDDISEITNTI